MARQKYSEEYKQEAVALTRMPGATITGVAKDLGINSHMLGRWRKTRDFMAPADKLNEVLQ